MTDPDWLPPNPWEPAPRDSMGDRDPTETYKAVGFALSQWEALEEALAGLFGSLIGSDSLGALTAYGSVASSAARLNMIIAAAETERVIDVQLFKEVRSLVDKEIGQLAGRRNEIAHGQVGSFTGGDMEGHYLFPPLYNKRKQHSFRSGRALGPLNSYFKYAYTAEQIARYGFTFRRYADRVDEMGRRVWDAHRDARQKPT